MHQLRKFLIEVHSSLWFIPTLIIVAAILLAFGLVRLDEGLSADWMNRFPRFFGVGAEGSRGLLSSIASSMITVAGVAFSITIAALAQASAQYTPRILHNFMRDRANQVVLGTFAGIFSYCLVVLRTIRGGDEGLFVPSLSVIASLALALLGIGVLIFFIHHIAASLQATTIIASAAEKTFAAVDNLFPEPLGTESSAEEEGAVQRLQAEHCWQPIPSRESGYIQHVDIEALLRFARQYDAVFRMECGIGEFICAGVPLATLALRRELTAAKLQEVCGQVNDIFVVGRFRTIEQDAAFGLRQIVDIALRALSPGVNDTTTAVTCVDYLTAILVRLAPRRISAAHRYDQGVLRLIARGPDFNELLNLAFDQIRQNASGNVAIILRVLEALENIATATNHTHRQQALAKQAMLFHELAEHSVSMPADREKVTARARQTLHAILQTNRDEGAPHHTGGAAVLAQPEAHR